jgi:hypothetical protein
MKKTFLKIRGAKAHEKLLLQAYNAYKDTGIFSIYPDGAQHIKGNKVTINKLKELIGIRFCHKSQLGDIVTKHTNFKKIDGYQTSNVDFDGFISELCEKIKNHGRNF